MRAEGHLAAHAQDSRRMDVGGERPFPVHVSVVALLRRSWPSERKAGSQIVPRNVASSANNSFILTGTKSRLGVAEYIFQHSLTGSLFLL